MFFITANHRIRPYSEEEPWRKVQSSEAPSDQDHHERSDDEPQEEKEEGFNFLDYIQPLVSSGKKLQATLMVKAYMTAPVLTFACDMPLAEAQKTFLKHKFAQIPVVTQEGRLIGVVDRKDLFGDKSRKADKLEEVMREEILCANEQTDLLQIAELFFQEQIKWLPIINERHCVIGVITGSDLMKTALKLSHLLKKA